jgi:hypothetical protein
MKNSANRLGPRLEATQDRRLHWDGSAVDMPCAAEREYGPYQSAAIFTYPLQQVRVPEFSAEPRAGGLRIQADAIASSRHIAADHDVDAGPNPSRTLDEMGLAAEA